MRTVCLTILALFCAACGGTIIKPMSPGAANAWHAENARLNDKEGYVFYAPQLVVTVQREILCLEPEAQGACAKTELRCGVSDPFVLPDFARPYTARFKRGFASSQSTVKFVDGWLLSEASSTTDNKALFDLIGAAAKFADGADGCKPGLYTVRPADPVTGAGFALTRIYQLPEP